ncbi:MAG: hypothetical protein ACFFC7_25700 [Candidatus Hermodarchaeota archaeon]
MPADRASPSTGLPPGKAVSTPVAGSGKTCEFAPARTCPITLLGTGFATGAPKSRDTLIKGEVNRHIRIWPGKLACLVNLLFFPPYSLTLWC